MESFRLFFIFREKEDAEVLETISKILTKIDDFVWGVPLIVLILAVGIYLTIRLGGLQIRHLPKALKFMVKNEEGGEGEVTSFGALCTALSATIGTGNIVGVATALVAGGPGALFWMWCAALLGMATKYAEGVLAIKYRKIDQDGHVIGGPFYYIENGMGKSWKWLAMIFAFFGAGVGLLGIGTFTQVNGISDAVKNFFDPNQTMTVELFGRNYSWTVIIAGVILTILVALVVIGGIKRISHVSQVVVPFMAVLYVVVCFILLICNVERIPGAFMQIIEGAFGLRAAAGGALGAVILAMQKGIARGIFSNEAGLGSAPIAAAAAQTKEPVRQGLVSMTGTFIDTVVICTMTGLSIVMMGSWDMGMDGVAVTNHAFQNGLPFSSGVASFILMLCLVFFAFTTILGWNYYGERCIEYMFKGSRKAVMVYRWLYILAVFIGPYMTVSAVWTIADIFNGLMALPNLVAIIALSGVVAKETKRYFSNPLGR
jgi:AGCS family alanine or glycine:cation symporter